MKLYIILGLLPHDEGDTFYGEVGWTLVFDDEEKLKAEFPDVEYIALDTGDGGLQA